MPTKITLLLQNVNKLPNFPIPVQGQSGKNYGHATFDPKVADGHHAMTLPYGPDTWKILKDLTLGSHRPNSNWFIRDIVVTVGNDTEMQLAEMLDAAHFKIAQLEEENALLRSPKLEVCEPHKEQTTITAQQETDFVEACQSKIGDLREEMKMEKPVVTTSEQTGAKETNVEEEEFPETGTGQKNEVPHTAEQPPQTDATSKDFRKIRRKAIEAGIDVTGINDIEELKKLLPKK